MQVAYATANGTASAGTDYTAGSGTVSFAAGETSKTVIVAVSGDTTPEADETFFVDLASPVNATISDAQGQGTIQNDDTTISIDDVAQLEGNSGTTNFTFTVSLSQASALAVQVDYATANGTASAGSDYTAGSGTVSFAAGETSKTVIVAVSGDTTPEADETFFVNLTAPVNATISDAQGQGTIQNDDTTISIDDVAQLEGNSGTTNFTFTVSLSQASALAVQVDYATANGTASAGTDYTAGSGTVSFAAGETSKTVIVAVSGDTTPEADETFFVDLTSPVNATIGDAQGQGTIQNDDTTISIDDVAQLEGDSGTSNFTFTVSLSQASALAVQVAYATANGTASAGSDYTAGSGTVSFAAGETSKTVIVAVSGDTTPEADETFFVDLTSPVNATISDAQGQGTIQNDDTTISIDDVTQLEGDSGTSNFTFTVSLSQASALAVQVAYATANGTASAGSDYTAGSGTVSFAAGETSKTVIVAVSGDTTPEADETFFVDLTSPLNATISDVQGQGTIQNDDTTISIDDVAQLEGDSGTSNFTFTVSLSQASALAVQVAYATANGTASAGTDYTAGSGTVSFAAGETSKTVIVAVSGDTTPEADETFFVDLTAPVNATISDAQGQGTIQNDDTTISIDDVAQLEGNSGTSNFTFTVSLSQASPLAVQVAYATANGTASAGSDYTAGSGTVSFAAGETNKTVIVAVSGDTTPEADETFFVDLTSPLNATISGRPRPRHDSERRHDNLHR